MQPGATKSRQSATPSSHLPSPQPPRGSIPASGVEVRRGGSSLRFRTPLIEPDGRVSRIRLSDGLRRRHTGHQTLRPPQSLCGDRSIRSVGVLSPKGQSPWDRTSGPLAGTPEARPLRSTGVSGFIATTGLSDFRPGRRPVRRSTPARQRPADADRIGSPTFRVRPCVRAVPITPANRAGHFGWDRRAAAFPGSLSGRRPRLHFRGLLGIHLPRQLPGVITARTLASPATRGFD